MVIKIVANLACSFIGTIAYAVMFQVPRRFYIGCGITGSVGWMIYKLASVYCSVAVASFIGTVCTVLVARMLTVRSEEHTSELQSRPHISYAVF